MEEYIPTSIQPLIDEYLHGLEPLGSHFYGIYIFGSVALGGFETLESDIDILVLTRGRMNPDMNVRPRFAAAIRILGSLFYRAQDIACERHAPCFIPGDQRYLIVVHAVLRSASFNNALSVAKIRQQPSSLGAQAPAESCPCRSRLKSQARA